MLPNQTFVHDDVTVTYRFRPGTQDRRHLVVMFSGYRRRGTFDFSGSTADSIKCDILWIEDWFEDGHTYYIRTGRGFQLAYAIQALIERVLATRRLRQQDCTLAGFSKGASGALFHALEFGYENIICAAPRINIGSATRTRNPDVFRNMTLTGSDSEVLALDSLLPDLLSGDENRERNIYLFSSPDDYQYATEIEPFLAEFEKYRNFNFVRTESPLVREHIDVTWYNIPLILATIVALADGAPPSYGFVNNGDGARERLQLGRPSISEVASRNHVVSSLAHLYVEEGRLFPEGHVFVKGHEAGDYDKVRRQLVLSSGTDRRLFPLGGLSDPRKSSQFFENEYCDYSKVKFASYGRKGIDIGLIPDGRYRVSLAYQHDGLSGEVESVSVEGKKNSRLVGESVVSVTSDAEQTFLVKQPVLANGSLPHYFSLDRHWLKNATLHIQGYFVVAGQPTPNWSDVSFYAVFCEAGTRTVLLARPLAKDRRPDASTLIDDPWSDYSKSYFATPKYTGIDVSLLGNAKYDVYVTSHTHGGLNSTLALRDHRLPG